MKVRQAFGNVVKIRFFASRANYLPLLGALEEDSE